MKLKFSCLDNDIFYEKYSLIPQIIEHMNEVNKEEIKINYGDAYGDNWQGSYFTIEDNDGEIRATITKEMHDGSNTHGGRIYEKKIKLEPGEYNLYHEIGEVTQGETPGSYKGEISLEIKQNDTILIKIEGGNEVEPDSNFNIITPENSEWIGKPSDGKKNQPLKFTVTGTNNSLSNNENAVVSYDLNKTQTKIFCVTSTSDTTLKSNNVYPMTQEIKLVVVTNKELDAITSSNFKFENCKFENDSTVKSHELPDSTDFKYVYLFDVIAENFGECKISENELSNIQILESEENDLLNNYNILERSSDGEIKFKYFKDISIDIICKTIEDKDLFISNNDKVSAEKNRSVKLFITSNLNLDQLISSEEDSSESSVLSKINENKDKIFTLDGLEFNSSFSINNIDLDNYKYSYKYVAELNSLGIGMSSVKLDRQELSKLVDNLYEVGTSNNDIFNIEFENTFVSINELFNLISEFDNVTQNENDDDALDRLSSKKLFMVIDYLSYALKRITNFSDLKNKYYSMDLNNYLDLLNNISFEYGLNVNNIEEVTDDKINMNISNFFKLSEEFSDIKFNNLTRKDFRNILISNLINNLEVNFDIYNFSFNYIKESEYDETFILKENLNNLKVILEKLDLKGSLSRLSNNESDKLMIRDPIEYDYLMNLPIEELLSLKTEDQVLSAISDMNNSNLCETENILASPVTNTNVQIEEEHPIETTINENVILEEEASKCSDIYGERWCESKNMCLSQLGSSWESICPVTSDLDMIVAESQDNEYNLALEEEDISSNLNLSKSDKKLIDRIYSQSPEKAVNQEENSESSIKNREKSIDETRLPDNISSGAKWTWDKTFEQPIGKISSIEAKIENALEGDYIRFYTKEQMARLKVDKDGYYTKDEQTRLKVDKYGHSIVVKPKQITMPNQESDYKVQQEEENIQTKRSSYIIYYILGTIILLISLYFLLTSKKDIK